MEPLSTVILLASFAGLPATTSRNILTEKRERAYSQIATLPQGFVLTSPGFASAGLSLERSKAGKLSHMSNVAITLAGYENLEDGWDGEGSVKPESESIKQAITFVSSIPSAIPLPKAMLSSDGQIGLYWDTEDKYADINFDADGSISLYVRDETGANMRESYVAGANPAYLDNAWLTPLLDLFSGYKVSA